jgi:hypothetical protein
MRRTEFSKQIGFEWVTPEMAKDWLSRADNQRPIRPTRVAQLVRDYHSDNLGPSGDPVAIGREDEGRLLLNGQHRLSMVVAVGEPVLLCVWRDCPKDAVFDRGKGRTNADLAMFDGRPHPAEWSRILNVAVHLWSSAGGSSYCDLIAYGGSIGAGVEWAARSLAGHRKTIVAPVMAGLAVTYSLEPKRIQALFDAAIGDGADLPRGSPELLARNWIRRNRVALSSFARHGHDERFHELLCAIWLGRNAIVRGHGSKVPGVGSDKLLAALEWTGEARIKKGLWWKPPRVLRAREAAE